MAPSIMCISAGFPPLLTYCPDLTLLLPGMPSQRLKYQTLASGSASRGAQDQIGCKCPAEESKLCPKDNQNISKMKTTTERATL